MSNKDKVYGWWSASQAKIGGYTIYTRSDGSRVNVSMVSPTNQHHTMWTDIKPLGEVLNFIIHVKPGETVEGAFARKLAEQKNKPSVDPKKVSEDMRTFLHSPGLTTFMVFRS